MDMVRQPARWLNLKASEVPLFAMREWPLLSKNIILHYQIKKKGPAVLKRLVKFMSFCDKVTLRDAITRENCSFFEHCSKGLWPPSPFYLNICHILQGVFLNAFLSIWYNVPISPPKCCINVGVREAPCKKSFGILASYWTPPKIQ